VMGIDGKELEIPTWTEFLTDDDILAGALA